jgi:hypothetical protein
LILPAVLQTPAKRWKLKRSGNFRRLKAQIMHVQSLWIGNRLSTLERMCVNSFLVNGFDFDLYTYGPLENIPPGTTLKDGNEIIAEDMIPRFRYSKGRPSVTAFSNIFRYKLLLDRGGIWVDMDVVCLRPFGLGSDYCFQIGRSLDGTRYIESAFIAAPKGSRLMRECYEQSLGFIDMAVEWGTYGPDLLERCIKQLGLTRFATRRLFFPIFWDETHLFQTKSLRATLLWLLFSQFSYVIHLCNEMWRCNKIEKDGKAPPQSIYARLQRRYLPGQTHFKVRG